MISGKADGRRAAFGWTLFAAVLLLAGGCLPEESSAPGGADAGGEAGAPDTADTADTADAGEVGREDVTEDAGADTNPVPFRAGSDHLKVWDDGAYSPLFLKAVNLGVAVPGTLAGELAASREQYERWLDQIHDAGFNAIRIYTLHYPRFYEVFREHNRRHSDDPLYLLHGIWAPEESSTGNLVDVTEEFDANIREVVESVHGDAEIEHRFGKAYGTYEANISRWTLGYVIGREFAPNEVMLTNTARPDWTSFEGTYFSVDSGDPAEIWLARRLETLVDYEQSNYGVQRPVSVSSWPTLDPLDHPTEDSEYSSEDVAELDFEVIEAEEHRGGLFASYHAYPYYPNFMSEDPDYREHSDEHGPNAYLGYLFDLKNHYEDRPLVIAEFGVPTSWVNAHSGYEGMNHGGHTEREQGRAAGRMFANFYESNTAGGALFAWIDEWWKPTWITNPRDFPFERRRLWHNTAAPEQNFGMVAFDLGDPDFGAHPEIGGAGSIPSAEVATDASYFYLRLQLGESLASDDRVVIGFDTYSDSRGESILPGGVETTNRSEFALEVEGRSSAELSVMEAYQMVGIWRGEQEEGRSYRSVQSDGGGWELVRFQNSQPHGTSDGEYWFEATYHDAGDLRVRSEGERSTNLDAVIHSEEEVFVRIPWTYLGVTDPSRRRVMHDDPETEERETRETDGIAVSVARNGELLFESDRYGWETWEEAPETTERVKRSLPIVEEALESLPDHIDGSDDE